MVKIDELRGALGMFAPADEEARIVARLGDAGIQGLARVVSVASDQRQIVAIIVNSTDEVALNGIIGARVL